MQKAHLDILGTCLDTFSFLLVTTDLYGEEKLRELGERLHRPLKIDQVTGTIWLILVSSGLWIFDRYYEAHLAWFKQNADLARALTTDLGKLSALVLLAVSILLALMVMPVLSLFTRAAAFVIDRWKMKGVFLMFGAFLFVAARAISVWQSLEGK